MTTQRSPRGLASHSLTAILASAGLAALTCGASTASAQFPSSQNRANADAVYNGFISAYLQTTNVNGHTYPLPYICNSLTDRNLAFMWQQAYMISGLEDAYAENYSASRLSLITSLLDGFNTQNGTSLTWDSWNDDIEWADIALAHGYEQTGKTAYLNAAIESWNNVWNRGWSTDLGGGIWENQNKGSKCVLSNAPFVIAGCILYQATGDSAYLTKCQQSYSWMRSKCFNTSTGQVIEGLSSSGAALTSNNSYNHGIFLQAANALYQVTGTAQYFNDAQLTVNWVVNNHTIMTEDHPNNGPFGSEEFFRGLSIFAVQNDLWATYCPWLEANCTAAWNNRRTDYNITWNKYTTATPTTNLLAMEMISSVIVQAVTQIGGGLDDGGLYEFESLAAPGKSLNVYGAGTAAGTKVIIWTDNGDSNARWTAHVQADGHFELAPSNATAMHLNVDLSNGGGGSGSAVQIYNSNNENSHWFPELESDGNYEIIPQSNTGLRLNVAGSVNANGTNVTVSTNNGTQAQRWKLIRKN